MHYAYKFLSSILFIIFSHNLSAQDIDLIKIRFAYYPKQSIEDASIDAEIGFYEWHGQLLIPQFFNTKKTIFTHRISYTNLRVDTEANLPSGLIESSKHYHTISYNLGLIQSLSPKWRLILNLNPTLASDLRESIGGDDLLYQANAMLVNTKSKTIKYGFGLAYTTRFGRQIVLPTGMFTYQSPKMRLNILLPTKASIMFNSKSKTISYGLEAGLNGGLFNNTSEIQTISTMIDETGYSRLVIGPAIDLILKNAIKIHFNAGVAVGRRLDFVNANEEIFNSTPEIGPFFSVCISFTPKKKNAEIRSN